MNLFKIGICLSLLYLSACGTRSTQPDTHVSTNYALRDTAAYLQKDPRWSQDKLGGSGDTMETDGCLVTATAMVLTNLGLQVTPGELNSHLKRTNSYTSRGWLVWSGIEKVTQGRAKAQYFETVSDEIIMGCIRDGAYPLVRFILPNGRTHWAMILHRDARGYHMRDPLRASRAPLIFPGDSSRFKAVRCVGRA